MSTPLATDRDRLIALAERYLDAMVAHEPGRVNFSPAVRFTENGQLLEPGSGRWLTVTAREPGGQWFADPAAGQVALWGGLHELGGPAIFALRLKVDGEAISEVETLVVRPGGALFDLAAVCAPRRAFLDVVEPSQRGSRAELVGVANRYFDGIEQDDGDIVPVADECVRIENGVQTTRVASAEEEAPWRAMGVAEQLTGGFFRYIEAIRDRRFPIVDEERGLVLCHVRFDHPGNIETAGRRVVFGYPNSAAIFEVFKVEGGRIQHVEAVGTLFPYRMDLGWAAGPLR